MPGCARLRVSGDAGSRLAETRQRLRAKLGAETAGDGEELEAPQERDDPNRSGEESNTDEEEQIADRNQTGAGEREDFSDLDPRRGPGPGHV